MDPGEPPLSIQRGMLLVWLTLPSTCPVAGPCKPVPASRIEGNDDSALVVSRGTRGQKPGLQSTPDPGLTLDIKTPGACWLQAGVARKSAHGSICFDARV